MSHEDSLRLWTEPLPALQEIANEPDLPSSFEVNTATGERIEAAPVGAG